MESVSIKDMETGKLVEMCVQLDKERKKSMALLNSYKAELQVRGVEEMEDHNVKYVKFYGTEEGSAAVMDSMSLDALNPDKLKELIGEGVWKAKVKELTETKYKYDTKFERMLKAIFTGDYIMEMSMDEFLDQMTIKPDAKQKKLLLKKLKGEFEKDKATLVSVLLGAPAKDVEKLPDFDVELWYIYRIKNAELIKAFLPEEMIDGTIKAIKQCIIVETKTAITLDYDAEKEE